MIVYFHEAYDMISSEPIVVKHSRVADIPQNYSGDMLKVFLNKERTIRNLHDLWTFLHFVATNENPIDLTRTAVVLVRFTISPNPFFF